MSDNKEYPGQQGTANANSDFNKTQFLIFQMLGMVNTCTLVKVAAVTNAGEVAPVGFVDVIPLVNMVDGLGKAVEHTTIYKLPYLRLQGGSAAGRINAIIIDPKVDDIGIAVFAQRDISNVKSTKKRANPGSRRRFAWSDGIYIGGVLNGTPNQYVRFNEEGIRIWDNNTPGNKIDMLAAGIKIYDDNGNIIDMTSTGVKITDKNTVNTIEMKSTGIDITDTNGNSIVMKQTTPFVKVTSSNGSFIEFRSDSENIRLFPNSGIVEITGALIVTGTVTAEDCIAVKAGPDVSLEGHVHSGVTVGAGNTGAPV